MKSLLVLTVLSVVALGNGQQGNGQQYVWNLLKPPLTAAEVQAILTSKSDQFPMYNDVPQTDFNCASKQQGGFYADVQAGCQAFHRCDINGNMTSYLCVNSTVFNQITLVCDFWFNVDCQRSVEFENFANSRLYTDKVLFDTPPADWIMPGSEGSQSSGNSNNAQPAQPAQNQQGSNSNGASAVVVVVKPATAVTKKSAAATRKTAATTQKPAPTPAPEPATTEAAATEAPATEAATTEAAAPAPVNAAAGPVLVAIPAAPVVVSQPVQTAAASASNQGARAGGAAAIAGNGSAQSGAAASNGQQGRMSVTFTGRNNEPIQVNKS